MSLRKLARSRGIVCTGTSSIRTKVNKILCLDNCVPSFLNKRIPKRIRESRFLWYEEAKRIRQNKSKTSLRISSHFWTNIEYSHRFATLIFVEILYESWSTPEWEYEFFLSVETSWFSSVLRHDNFLKQSQTHNWNHLTFLKKIYSFWRTIGWVFQWKFWNNFRLSGM